MSQGWKAGAVAAALAGILIQIEINGGLLRPPGPYPVSAHVQFALLVLCCALLIAGLGDGWPALPRWRDLPPARRLELAGVAALTVVALLLRVANLEGVRAFVDEANFFVATQRFELDVPVQLLRPFSPTIAFPLVFPYFQWLAAGAANGLTALRIPSAVFGTLTIPATYLLAKQIFDRHTAFVAAALLAALPLHVQWSRLGLNNIADPLFGVLTFALLVRGARRGETWHFAVAGVCFGLTQYFYEGGRLFYPVLTVVWGGVALAVFRRHLPPRREAFVFIFPAVAVALPIYSTLFVMNAPIAKRLSETALGALRSTGDVAALFPDFPARLSEAVQTFVIKPETVTYYGGDYPYIHAYLLPFLLLGGGVLIWRWRTPGGSLVLLWIAGVVGAVALLIAHIDSSRLINALPPLMIVCAAGVVAACRLVTRDRIRQANALRVAVALAIGALHTQYYFDVHIDRFTRQHYKIQPEQEIVFHARTLPAGWRAYLLSTNTPVGARLDVLLHSYNPNVSIVIPIREEIGEFVDALAFSHQNIFYMLASDMAAFDVLNTRFELRGPLQWPQPYAPPGVEYVAYLTFADREAGEP